MMKDHPNAKQAFDGLKHMWTQRDWNETVEHVEHRLKHKNDTNRLYWSNRHTTGRAHQGRGVDDFTEVKNFKGAVDLVKNGWPDGEKRLSGSIAEALELPAMKEIYEEIRGYDICGYDLDVPRYLTGDPEYFVADNTELTATKKTLSVVLNAGYYGAWSSHQIFNRGAALCAIVDALERNGRDVELIAGAYFNCGHNAMRIRNVVKKSGEQFDLSRTAFALAHPAMFRQVSFAEMERKENYDVTCGGVGGHSLYIDASAKEREAEPDTCFILQSTKYDSFNSPTSFNTLGDALEITKKVLFDELKRIGVMN